MTRHVVATLIVAALAVGLGAAAGAAAGLTGAAIASLTALASLGGFRLLGRSARPLQSALLVFVVMFLVRLVLVALGLVHVTRAGESVTAFVVAFFVPYFAFAAIEGSYVHALGRSPGKTA